ncbi:MAG: ACP S-malonyltransferase [Alphaproteobacteria bacterium]|nr:ACP S-malonyltransferase [Alphaproteobacteria bacterium]
MSSIFIFPGQGAQVVGMGADLYKNNGKAREVFDAVDDALGEKLSDVIFNGPMETLTLTANVQPAILATSLAMFRAAQLPTPDYVAGHSLGEYSALCAAGALSISDAARLVRARGNAMQNAVPLGAGITAVVLGLDIDVVKQICEKFDADVANDNCPGQVVISGLKEKIEPAMDALKEAGARRVMPLALSVPVHCRAQEGAAEKMREILDTVEIKKPIVPIISNKTAKPMTDAAEIKESLIYQMTHGVRWRESVLEMVNLGIDDLTEIGPGNVLCGLVNRTTDKINAHKWGI